MHEAIEGVGVAVVFAAGRGSTVPFAARLETVQKSPFPTFELAEGTSLYPSLPWVTLPQYGTAVRYRRYNTVFTRPILYGYLTRINETRIVKLR